MPYPKTIHPKNEPPSTTGRARELSSGSIALALSLSTTLAWTLMMLRCANAYVSYFEHAVATLENVYLFYEIAFAIVCIIAVRVPEKLERLLSTPFCGLAAAAFLMAITLAVPIISTIGEELGTGAAIGILSGLPSGLLVFSIALRFYRLGAREGLAASVLAFGTAMVFLVAFTVVPEEYCLIIAGAMCLIASSGILFYDRNSKSIEKPPDFTPLTINLDHRLHLFAGFIALTVIWSAIAEFLRAFYLNAGMNSMGSGLFAHTQAIALAIIMMMALACLFGLIALPRSFNFSLPYRAVFLISLSSVALLPLVLTDTPLIAVYAIASSAVVLIDMVTWIIVLAFARIRNACAIATIAVVRMGATLGTCAGFFANRLIWEPLSSSEASLVITTALLALTLALVYLTAFTENDADGIARLYPSKRRERFRSKCQQVADRFGLSERELEVMTLLGRGNNAEHIASTLFISYNTVTTHRKHIYQKLDIHSQQDLITLLDATESGAQNTAVSQTENPKSL